MLKRIDEIKPRVVIVDPVSSFVAAGTDSDAKSMLMRMIDLLKTRQITALMTSLTGGGHAVEQSEVGISSLIDSWVMLRNLEQAGERTRTLSIIKSRGMKHSNQARELVLSDQGVDLAEVFIGPDGGILTGSLRVAQEAADRAAAAALEDETARKEAAMLRRRKAVEARIAEMQADLAAEADEVGAAIGAQASAASGRSTARAAQALGREQAGDPQTPSRWRPAMNRHQDRPAANVSPGEPAAKWELRLYVAGQNARSVTAFANLKKICEAHLAGRYRIEVIDLLENPQLSRDDQIVAIPTLVRSLPTPIRKVIGDLSNTEKTLVGLQLRPAATKDARPT